MVNVDDSGRLVADKAFFVLQNRDCPYAALERSFCDACISDAVIDSML